VAVLDERKRPSGKLVEHIPLRGQVSPQVEEFPLDLEEVLERFAVRMAGHFVLQLIDLVVHIIGGVDVDVGQQIDQHVEGVVAAPFGQGRHVTIAIQCSVDKLPADIRTPAYVLDVAALKRNLATVTRIRREAGCKVLLATKAWAMPAAFPLMRDVLDGLKA